MTLRKTEEQLWGLLPFTGHSAAFLRDATLVVPSGFHALPLIDASS